MKKIIAINYSRFLIFILISFMGYHTVTAQLFTKVSVGDIVNTPSDSRSINCVDVNGDGFDDVFISNGPSVGAPNFLYLNNGDGTFTTVFDDPIVMDTSAFDGATFADIDNDGDLDAYVVSWYGLKNYFYRNEEGSFTYEPDNASGALGTYSETASWSDQDGDGYVDLYVTNSGGDKKNLFYENNGGDDFSVISDGPVATNAYYSRGVNWVDYDNDGDPDLFVCNESNQKNNIYNNEGNGTFVKVEDLAPVSATSSSMSSSWGDVDNDGDLDLFIANSSYFNEEDNQLFFNDGDGSFSEATEMPVSGDGGCSYSSSFIDYDNDGDLDLFVGNGYCGGEINNFLYKNDGTGNFEKDTIALPDYSTPCSFGAAWGDFDDNGFMDLVVSTCKNSSSSPLADNMMFMNNGNDNHWLKIKLQGTVSNGSAIGARVVVTTMIDGEEVTQMREINSQDGYCSQNSMTAHFGLGDASGQVEVQVFWPSGNTFTTQLDADMTHFIPEYVTGKADRNEKNDARVIAYSDSGSGLTSFRIENPGAFILNRLTIIDMGGKVRADYSLNSMQKSMYLHMSFSLEAGVYVARLVEGKNSKRIKFIVK